MTKQEKSFEEVRSIIVAHRSAASRGVNTESILMSWKVGSYISARLQSNEWGSKVQSAQIGQRPSAQLRLNLQKYTNKYGEE